VNFPYKVCKWRALLHNTPDSKGHTCISQLDCILSFWAWAACGYSKSISRKRKGVKFKFWHIFHTKTWNLCDRGPLLKSSVFNTVKIVMVRLIPGRVTFKYNMFSKLESIISCRLIYNYLKTITVCCCWRDFRLLLLVHTWDFNEMSLKINHSAFRRLEGNFDDVKKFCFVSSIFAEYHSNSSMFNKVGYHHFFYDPVQCKILLYRILLIHTGSYPGS